MQINRSIAIGSTDPLYDASGAERSFETKARYANSQPTLKGGESVEATPL
jgi:hypothetical protein